MGAQVVEGLCVTLYILRKQWESNISIYSLASYPD